MQSGNNKAIATILKQFKLPNGNVDYPIVMQTPLAERIPSMYERDYLGTTALIGMAIAMAFDKMKFKRELPGGLVNDIADEVIDSAVEDNLGIEDVMLFLQGLVRGKYGNIEEMSVSRFMNVFEQYRQERHEAILNYRENEHLQFKALGDGNRTSKTDQLEDHFASFGNRISELKESLSYEKKLNQIDKF